MSRKRGSSAVVATATAACSTPSSLQAFLRSLPPSAALVTPTIGHNPHHFRRGAIVRVRMVNFMIYNDEEMFPGPGLNLLLGPNGSGKSTVVSAIGIALAGETKSVGRFDKLSEYVKSTADQCIVEVELFRGAADGRANLVVRRCFDKSHQKSDFFMGTEKKGSVRACKKAEVHAAMERLNIDINNLCVYLAQFRVGEFAELNAQELLAETEKSANPKLHRQHESLVEYQAAWKKKSETAAGSKKHTDALEAEVAGMQAEVRAQAERAETEEKIEMLKKRKPWCAVDEAAHEFERHARVLDERKAELKAELERNAPLREALAAKAGALKQAQRADDSAKEEVTKIGQKRQIQVSKQESAEQAIANARGELEQMDHDEETRERHLAKERATLHALETEVTKLRSPGMVDAEMLTLENEITAMRKAAMESGQPLRVIGDRLHEAESEKRSSEARLHTLQQRPVVTTRMKLLRRFPFAHKDEQTILTLKANGRLRAPVRGPLLAILEVEDPHCAAYIENVIPARQATSWVVETQDDMKTLLAAGIRTIIHASPLQPPRRPWNLDAINRRAQAEYDQLPPAQKHRTPPPYEIKWLDEAIKCDDVVRSALHDMFRMTALVYSTRDLSDAERDYLLSRQKNDHKLQNIFTPSVSYSTAMSPWTEDIAVRTDYNVKSAQILGTLSAADQAARVEMENLKTEVQKLASTLEALLQERQEIDTRVRKEAAARQAATAEATSRLQALQNERRQRKTCEDRLKATKARIHDLEQPAKNEARRKTFLKQISENEKHRDEATERITALEAELHEAHARKQQTRVALVQQQQEYDDVKAQVDSMSGTNKRLQHGIEEAKKQLHEARRNRDTLEQKANAVCSRDIFNACAAWMPADITSARVAALYDELQLSLSRSIGDASIKQRFERLSEEARRARDQSDLDAAQLSELDRQIKHLKETWLVEVKAMVRTIDAKFQEYFQRIGCQGRVELTEEEEKYGILIKVSFRNNVALQTLSASSQSGGEKSVSTMLYLLCLQEVTDAPFRIVDEINQGMDASNERTVFNQIVRSCEPKDANDAIVRRRRQAQREMAGEGSDDEEAAAKEAPQYFVVTPKLLPNLHYSDRVSIFNVYNGPHMAAQIDWDIDRFLKIALSGELEPAMARKRQKHIKEEQKEDSPMEEE